MRKTLLAGLTALVASAVIVPVALAATQVNTYTVTGAIKGGKGATKSKPKPVSVNFNYTVGEASGNRPSPVTKYSILFGGLTVNPTAIAGCSVSKLNASTNTAGLGVCPKASLVGGGSIFNKVGSSEDITKQDITCYLDLTTVNSTTKGHLLLWLQSRDTTTDPAKKCVISVHQAIDAKLVKKSSGTALEFGVPSNLLHPGGVGVLDNAVVNVQSTIKKVTGKVKGKKVGYFASTSCKSKQNISVAFTQESDNSTKTAKTSVPCTK